MQRPYKFEGTKGGEPGWLLKCRELLRPRTIAIAVPATALVVLGLVFAGQQLGMLRPNPTPAPASQPAQVSQHTTQSELPGVTGESKVLAEVRNQSRQVGDSMQSLQKTEVTVDGTTVTSHISNTVCEHTVRTPIDATYQAALKAEETLHQTKSNSILDSLLRTLRLQDEATRHEEALQNIESTYRSSLKTAGCTP